MDVELKNAFHVKKIQGFLAARNYKQTSGGPSQGISLIIFSSSRKLLESMAALAGIYYAPAIMIPILFGLVILISLYFSIKVSKAELQIKTITQELALLKQKVNDHLK